MRTEQLRHVIGERGPFVSVYVDASHDTEDAITRSELRWRAAETRLWDVGAGRATIEATRQAVLDPPAVGRSGRAVIAARGQVLLTEDFPVPPAADVVRWSELPYLLPLFSAIEPPVPHVVVLADKVGGHLRAIDGHGDPVSDKATHGAEQPLHHVSGGGLARGSMENRSEETVRRNARETADLAVRLAGRVDAELVILAGTVSARTAIHAELPHHVKKLTTELDVNAAHTDLDSAEVNDGVARLLAQRQAERDEAVLERWHVGSAHGTACEGLGKVTEALRSGAVETILVTDPSLSERTVWRGSDPSQVATDRAELPEAAECRADEAVPAAALGTSADVLVLTGAATLTDGIAALLRF